MRGSLETRPAEWPEDMLVVPRIPSSSYVEWGHVGWEVPGKWEMSVEIAVDWSFCRLLMYNKDNDGVWSFVGTLGGRVWE